MTVEESTIPYLDDAERLKVYQTLVDGCQHLWSKGKLVESRLADVLDNFVYLAEQDPEFLARFTSYAMNKLDSKDLKVVSIFANSLSDADGTPFSPGSKFKKPNYRAVSQAAIQQLDPKLVGRVVSLANRKVELGSRPKGTHFSRSLKTAIKKYLKYRETNPKAIEGIKRSGLSKRYMNLYRNIHLSPSKEAAEILGWKQKDGSVTTVKKGTFDFRGLSDLEVAQKIRSEKLPPQSVLGALPDKLSPVVAAAVLEQASGDQAVILSNMFEQQGLLKNKEVKKVYGEKIKTAKNALDRVERFQKEFDEDIQRTLKKSKSEKRKDDVGDIGKVFLHIDVSASMNQALEVAKNCGAIIAECVKDPSKNFHWGIFNHIGQVLPTPKSFEKDAFAAALYGKRSGGGTNCVALYKTARQLGCDVDIFITDQGHNGEPITGLIRKCESDGLGKPKAVLIVNVGRHSHQLATRFSNSDIPVTEVTPEALTESALVSQAVRTALLGATAVIDEVMKEPLLELPKWYFAVN
jgi:hypothetical protein